MKTRPSAPSLNFGLLAWLEETRIALPLKGVECQFQITGAVASVQLDQIYYQDAAQPLDCTYTFPLPAGAAVYRCELHVNGRVIRAKVEAREDARRIYQQQKAAGRRAALVETERENLFTLTLGNVQPGDVIVVRFAWFQVLDRAGDGLRLLVPTCPGIRYIPGRPLLRAPSGRGFEEDTDEVPDASRIAPPRIDALHPDAAYVSFEGRLARADLAAGTLSSPSHAICLREDNEAMAIELSDRDAVPDRDFVLSWREPQARQLEPQAWHWRTGRETYALLQLRAPAAVQVAEGFAQDFYFLIDRSGSMAGAKWQRTCEALRAFVGLLGVQDRVWITLFESDYRDFSDCPMAAPAVLADRGFQRMEELGTGGGTELRPATRHVLQQIVRHSADRRTTVLLITDGQVGNHQAILKAFQAAPRLTVHTFGIDTTVNDAFLKTLARQHRGGCWLQTPDDDIAGTIAALGDRLRRPVVTDLALRGAWENSAETLPDLHAGEIATLSLRGKGKKPVELIGRLPDGAEHRFSIALSSVGSEAIRLLWARERIATLLASDAQPEAIALAKKHNLLCEGAAFIAWDEAEQVQVAAEEIVQPAQAPRTVLRYIGASSPLCSPAPSAGAMKLASAAPLSPAPRRRSFLGKVSRGGPSAAAPRAAESPAATGFMEKLRQEGLSSRWAQALEAGRQAAVGGSVEQLLKWTAHNEALFGQFESVRAALLRASVPPEVIDLLLAWTVRDGSLDAGRLGKIHQFVALLDQLPFSAGGAAHRWREFLVATLGDNPEAQAAAALWLELEEPAEGRP